MRLIDADVLMNLLEKGWKTTSLDTFTHHTIDRTDVEGTPTIDAIPIDFIESEKRFVSELSTEAYESGNIERAKGLSNVALNLDALISNWGFIRGDEWRENRKKAMRNETD